MMLSFATWIEELRGDLGRGKLAGRGSITLRDGSWFADTDLAASVMLADLDHLDTLLFTRRQDLLDDFQHLREQLVS
jgi:hypothetical protein